MDHIHVDQDKLMKDKKCPFCGWGNDLDYSGDHTVVYQCKCCGFSTKFINPNDGFSEWELDDYDEGDDGAFMAAVEKAEREDLESTTVEHFVPPEETREGVHVIAVFSRINEKCKAFVEDCIEFEEETNTVWRKGESDAVRYLVKSIYTEF